MKMSWKQIKVFGFTITLPSVIIIVQQLDADQVEQFRVYKAGMSECPRCHKLFDGRAGLSFIMHLQDVHKVDSGASMDIVSELYRKLLHRNEKARSAVV